MLHAIYSIVSKQGNHITMKITKKYLQKLIKEETLKEIEYRGEDALPDNELPNAGVEPLDEFTYDELENIFLGDHPAPYNSYEDWAAAMAELVAQKNSLELLMAKKAEGDEGGCWAGSGSAACNVIGDVIEKAIEIYPEAAVRERMKVTKKYLQKIIKEETKALLSEEWDDFDDFDEPPRQTAAQRKAEKNMYAAMAQAKADANAKGRPILSMPDPNDPHEMSRHHPDYGDLPAEKQPVKAKKSMASRLAKGVKKLGVRALPVVGPAMAAAGALQPATTARNQGWGVTPEEVKSHYGEIEKIPGALDRVVVYSSARDAKAGKRLGMPSRSLVHKLAGPGGQQLIDDMHSGTRQGESKKHLQKVIKEVIENIAEALPGIGSALGSGIAASHPEITIGRVTKLKKMNKDIDEEIQEAMVAIADAMGCEYNADGFLDPDLCKPRQIADVAAHIDFEYAVKFINEVESILFEGSPSSLIDEESRIGMELLIRVNQFRDALVTLASFKGEMTGKIWTQLETVLIGHTQTGRSFIEKVVFLLDDLVHGESVKQFMNQVGVMIDGEPYGPDYGDHMEENLQKNSSSLILEQHRKNREAHPVTKKEWWYDA